MVLVSILWDGVWINNATLKCMDTVRTGKNVEIQEIYKRGQQEN
jgi:hypothetical protein